MNAQQYEKVKSSKGFIAALDQSGGSTPKALSLYGIKPEEYSGDQQMFDLMHAMRTRIVNSPAFNGDRVLAAILFEQTMDREISGRGTADYLWSVKRVVPFVKVDKGLADEADGVQLMKPMPDLEALLARAKAKGVFGTKMRSVIKRADAKGIESVVAQQFTIAKQILAAGLMPIVEPEVSIDATDKESAERGRDARRGDHRSSPLYPRGIAGGGGPVAGRMSASGPGSRRGGRHHRRAQRRGVGPRGRRAVPGGGGHHPGDADRRGRPRHALVGAVHRGGVATDRSGGGSGTAACRDQITIRGEHPP